MRYLILIFIAFIQISFAINWENITESELSALPISVFANMTPHEVSLINSEACKALTNSHLLEIPESSFHGFTKEQLKNFKGSTCSGFNYVKLYDLNIACLAGFSAECIKNIGPTDMIGFDAERISKLNPISCSGFRSEHILYIDIASAGFSAEQIGNFTSEGYSSACAGFHHNFLTNMKPAAFQGLTSQCVEYSPKDAWSFITQQQFSYIQPSTVNGFSMFHVSKMQSKVFSQITLEQFAQFSTESDGGCRGFNENHLRYIPAKTFGALRVDCLEKMQPSVLRRISSEQFTNFPLLVIGAIRAIYLKNIPANAFTSLTKEQVSKFSFDDFNSACYSLTSDKLKYLPLNAFEGFTGGCISHIPHDSFNAFSKEKLSKLSPQAISKISQEQFHDIIAASVEGLTSNQTAMFSIGACSDINDITIPYFTDDAIFGFTGNCISYFQVNAFKAFTPEKVSSLSQDGITGLSINQIRGIPPESFSGLTFDQASVLEKSCAGITGRQLLYMTNNSLAGIKSGCIENIEVSTFQNFTSKILGEINPYAVYGLKSAQLSAIPPSSMNGFNAELLKNLNVRTDVCFGFTGNQIKEMRPQCFAGFTKECLSNLKVSAMEKIDKFQFSNISKYSIPGLQGFMVMHIQKEVIDSLTIEKLNFFSDGAVSGFQHHQLVSLASKFDRTFYLLYKPEMFFAMDLSVINAFKQNIPFPLEPIFTELPRDITTLSWMAVAFLDDKFNFSTPLGGTPLILQLDTLSVSGLRKPHIEKILPKIFLDPDMENKFVYFTGDQIASLKKEQIQVIPADTLGKINTVSLKSFKAKYIPLFSGDQFKGFSEQQIKEFTCSQISKITEDQKNKMTENKKNVYQRRLKDCYSKPDQDDDNDTEETPTKTKIDYKGDDNTPLVIVGVIVGVLVIAVIVLAVVFLVMYKKTDNDNQLLEEYEELGFND